MCMFFGSNVSKDDTDLVNWDVLTKWQLAIVPVPD